MDRKGRACFGTLLIAMLMTCSIMVADYSQADDDAQLNKGSGEGDGFTVTYIDSETDGWGILQISLTRTLPDEMVHITVDGNSSAPMTQSQIAEKILVPRLSEGVHTITLDCGAFSSSVQVDVVSFISVESVELDRTSASMNVGDRIILKATVTPEDATETTVTWSTSNPSVAVVNDGGVTAVSKGTAIITASCGGSSAKCTITVKEVEQNIPVTGITLDRTSAQMNVGDVLTLKATVTPANATASKVTWSTSDPSVAVVDGGKVTAVSKGTAMITASCGGSSAACTVSVTSGTEVKSISIDSTWLSLNVGAESTILATVNPVVPGVEYVWSVGNGTGSVSIRDNGNGSATVKAEAAGDVTLTVTVKGTSISASCEIIIVSDKIEVISEDTKKNQDGTTTTTIVEKIDTGEGSITMKTTDVVKDSAGNVQGTEIVYEFKSDDSSIKTVTKVTIAEDGNGIADRPKVEVDMGIKGSAIDGTRSIIVEADQLKEALRQLERAKAVTGFEDLEKRIEVRADEGEGVNAMTATLDASSISSMSTSNGALLSISSEMGSIEIGEEVFTTMKSVGGEAIISVKNADDIASVPDGITKISQKSLYEVDLTVGGQVVHDLNGRVVLSLPFALSDGQDPNRVGIRYVDADGNLSSETFTATYSEGMVSFTTTHFSTFVVVYDDVATDNDSVSDGNSMMTTLGIVVVVLIIVAAVVFVMHAKGRS